MLKVGNTTTIFYINRMGSIRFPRLVSLSRDIWCWCAKRDLFIYASYIPSAQNFEADVESRVVADETEWALEQEFFDRIESYFGPFDIDLFAASINAKYDCFVFWFPDPFASLCSGCFFSALRQILFLCVFPFYFNFKSLKEGY